MGTALMYSTFCSNGSAIKSPMNSGLLCKIEMICTTSSLSTSSSLLPSVCMVPLNSFNLLLSEPVKSEESFVPDCAVFSMAPISEPSL